MIIEEIIVKLNICANNWESIKASIYARAYIHVALTENQRNFNINLFAHQNILKWSNAADSSEAIGLFSHDCTILE